MRRPRRSGICRAGAATLAALGLFACALPSTSSLRSEPPAAAQDAAPRAPVALPTTVRVRLSELERTERVRVDGAADGAAEFTREGALVRRADGALAARFEVQRAPGFPGLSIGERTYSGALSIAPHGAGGLRVENLVPFEDYVAGVVAAELVLWSALPAELEAQAVAARSYVLGVIAAHGGAARGQALWDDTRDQVYRGRFVPPPTARGAEVAERLRSAVARTAGRVLLDADGGRVDVRFHACCGGYTASSADVFPDARGTRTLGVPCAPCAELAADAADDPRRVRWEWRASAEELARLARELGLGARLVHLSPTRVDGHGRWLSVELTGDRGRVRIDANELRRRAGARALASARIVTSTPRPGEPLPAGLILGGVGRGHGVGLCQVGAHEYAARGWSAERILAHYFRGARVTALAPAP